MIALFLIFLNLFSPANPDSFRDEIQNYLKQNLSKYEKFEFEILQTPEKADRIIINYDKPFTWSSGLANINVTAVDKANNVSQSYITIKLKLFQKVLVSTESIKTKEPLSAEKCELVLLEVSQLRGVPILSKDEINGYEAKVKIEKGKVITEEMIEALPLIKSGDKINVSTIRGSVIVTADAIARQDGRLGEVIRIVTKNNKQFKAKVIDSNNVILVE